MSYTVTLSSKGQVIIPAPLRKTLNLDSGDTIIFTLTDKNTVEFRRGRTLDERLRKIRDLIKTKTIRDITDDEAIKIAHQNENVRHND
jgi:AbrB family looped-hinge helix DNA binding protein